jgi:hypothetical protein
MQIARYPSICVRANRPPRCSGFTINHIGGIMCPPSPAALEIPLSGRTTAQQLPVTVARHPFDAR